MSDLMGSVNWLGIIPDGPLNRSVEVINLPGLWNLRKRLAIAGAEFQKVLARIVRRYTTESAPSDEEKQKTVTMVSTTSRINSYLSRPEVIRIRNDRLGFQQLPLSHSTFEDTRCRFEVDPSEVWIFISAKKESKGNTGYA